jgi:hypothetical protein
MSESLTTRWMARHELDSQLDQRRPRLLGQLCELLRGSARSCGTLS